ncbi:hypothetical protein EYC80_004709 [Monilinia laxa]|uniref:Uncharacterized protein n=1 Tax=Monilinia laxa TaxID=61186 RepID=A0A5N6KHU6_MONLA|nr:hypothetical protein EYC80_004709 [Monilinia laxa]
MQSIIPTFRGSSFLLKPNKSRSSATIPSSHPSTVYEKIGIFFSPTSFIYHSYLPYSDIPSLNIPSQKQREKAKKLNFANTHIIVKRIIRKKKLRFKTQVTG